MPEALLLKNLKAADRSAFLDSLFHYYVELSGLGGMAKPDLDALLVYLYVTYCCGRKFDAFQVSTDLKISESRAKSLWEKAELKYSQYEEGDAWVEILEIMANTTFELESIEKGQIYFKLDNPSLYRFFQKRVREYGTATYNKSAERVTIPLATLFKVLERIDDLSKTQFKTRNLDDITKNREITIRHIVQNLDPELRKKIKKKNGKLLGIEELPSHLASALSVAANLATVWPIIAACL
ncbi:MAG: hypothetical protein R3F50_21515 [Gammaproteobacteria bacterium]